MAERYIVLKSINQHGYAGSNLFYVQDTKNNDEECKVKIYFFENEENALKAFNDSTMIMYNLKYKGYKNYTNRPIHCFVNVSTSIWIVSPYITWSLREAIDSNDKTKYFYRDRIINWFLQMLSGLQYIFEQDLLHRNLKPENIFLNRSLYITIGDFGVLTVLEANHVLMWERSPTYMSPDLEPSSDPDQPPPQYTKKTDIWALGCLFYEMMNLVPAFNTANDLKNYAADSSNKLPVSSVVRHRYGCELLTLVDEMLSSNNEDMQRYLTQVRALKDEPV